MNRRDLIKGIGAMLVSVNMWLFPEMIDSRTIEVLRMRDEVARALREACEHQLFANDVDMAKARGLVNSVEIPWVHRI